MGLEVWTEWAVHRLVMRAQGWFEGKGSRTHASGAGEYRLVPGEDEQS